MARPDWWDHIEYFEPSEFDSPDEHGSGAKYMRQDIVEALDCIRARVGFPLRVTSGYRTAAHNKAVGGEPNSAHRYGWAADIKVTDSRRRLAIIKAALEPGVLRYEAGPSLCRIGIAKTFIHLDAAPAPKWPQNVMWMY